MTVPDAALTCTTSVRGWLTVPGGSVPMFQMTLPLFSTPPADADTKLVPVGRVSRTTTLLAAAVPLLP